MDGEFDGVQGRIVVNGDRYRVEVNGSELYCDGKLLYTFRADEDEVTIERPDPGDRSLLSNPPRFFRLEGDDFEVAYKGREDAGGRTSRPVGTDAEKSRCRLSLDRDRSRSGGRYARSGRLSRGRGGRSAADTDRPAACRNVPVKGFRFHIRSAEDIRASR